ncbi:MAG: oligosaccharide flippase family protein [Tenuifilaceae bacterium]|jgi:O-antigen/teichoic acid export membrane protein|nr:oligosaccharide flippase family protein [Tenuifilaceae bacterium]
MIANLKTLVKSNFLKHFFTLITGNVIAQFIGLAAIPVLSRMYTPDEFGQVALFMGIVSVIAIAANGRYDMAIVLPKRNGQAFHLLVGGFAIAALFAALTYIFLLIIQEKVTSFFESSSFNSIVWFLPILIFLMGTHKSLQFWFTRNQQYTAIAQNRVVQSSTQTAVKLSRTLFSNGYWGLVVGTLVGEFLSWVHFFVRLIKTDLWRFRLVSCRSMLRSFKEYSNFPKFLLPMGVVNTFSVNILIFALSAITTSTMVGFYERAWRVVNIPLSMLSTSFGNVFYERMTKSPNPQRLYLMSYFANLTIGIVVLLPIVLWGEEIFVFVLGNDWAVAGTVARIIAPLTLFNYATACISNVFSVYQKNQILLVWQIFYLAVVLSWILLARTFDIFILIRVFAYIGAALYAALAAVGYGVVVSEMKRNLKMN